MKKSKPSKIINNILDKLIEENNKKMGFGDTLDCLAALRHIAILRFLDKDYSEKELAK